MYCLFVVQWWNGEAMWRSLMLPEYAQFDMSWISQVPWLAILFCWSTFFIEIGYAFFIWHPRTRKIWVLATMALHIGIAVFLGLVTFSMAMAVLTFSIFGVSAKPKHVSANTASPYQRLRWQTQTMSPE